MKFINLLIYIIFLITNLYAFQGNLTPDKEYLLGITEPSGIVYNNLDGTLYTNSDGSNSHIYQITTNGITLDTLFIAGQDFEGISFNATFDTIFVVEEAVSRISKYSLQGNLVDFINVDVETSLNGLEGITVNPENSHIYLVKEAEPSLLLELSNDGTELSRDTLNFLNSGDASGITIHPVWKTLFILSHQNKAIYETTLSGKYLRDWDIPVEKAEGITFNSDLDSIYIVDDQINTLYVFPFTEKPFIYNLYINEFMAGNNISFSDNNGDFDDWIELYNPNDYNVDIGGLSIVDNFTRTGLWQIPKGFSTQTTIPANGHIILWADEQTIQGPLHVNLKLSKAGEQIALYNNLLLLDSLSFPAQTDDISFGRQTDGGSSWEFFNPGSPNSDNTNGSIVLKIKENEETKVNFFNLNQNYPNPFNPETIINYELQIPCYVKLSVHSISGEEITTLVNRFQASGQHSINFDARNLSSGIYFYTLQAGNSTSTKKMILVK